jgi:DNA repair exonuclease SbcCD ATPase subunit
LRQIETLQTQYALASENWQGIEGTLTSRVAALEKERDESAKRESDIRRKAREINSKARRLEDELESVNDRARTLEQDLLEQRTSVQKLQARLAQAESAAEEARADLQRQKKVMEAEFQQKLEEEKAKWRLDMQSQLAASESNNYLRAASPSTTNRKHSPDPLALNRRGMPRSISSDMPLSPMDRMLFEDSRRPSTARSKPSQTTFRSPEFGAPSPLLRQDSIPTSLAGGLNGSATPSIHTYDHDDDARFDHNQSPHGGGTINDMISVSTAGAGPSVQLVERMSAKIRDLESEKSSLKEEIARLTAQRDEARDSVVQLMQEVDEKKSLDEKVAELEKELGAVRERYDAALEMLGEKSERVEELEGDVSDLKKILRETVEAMK